MTTRRRPEAIIVMWMDGEIGDLTACTLAYNGGKGHVRVYPRDGYDHRCVLGRGPLPYFSSKLEAVKHMAANIGIDGMCQVPLYIAASFGWPREALDPHALRHLEV
jgi:hypothetical protein